LQLVKNERIHGKIKQTVLHTLGRLDLLQKTGQINSLMISLQRFSEKLAVLDAAGKSPISEKDGRSIGAPLLFRRIWEDLGIDVILNRFLEKRNFGFSVEKTIFFTVLHRLIQPGSDRQATRWQVDYRIPDLENVPLHHCYRAMGWLGAPLPSSGQDVASPFSPRCQKDLIEEALFQRNRTLFSNLSMVFLDTTSIYFEGKGGASLGENGFSRDHRPDLKQMVVAVVLNEDGQPLCTEIWPGNVADVSSLIPIALRLDHHFKIKNVCIVADRGMISEANMNKLVDMGWKYILGVRMRSIKDVRDNVLSRAGRFEEVFPERTTTKDPSPLKVKEVIAEERRYIVCLNEEEARKDARDRQAILESLSQALKKGEKSLIGNKGFRRYLSSQGPSFFIDEKKIEEESRYDGKWVLTTNTDLSPKDAALKYKELWMVEDIFRSMKSLLETRPVFHKFKDTILGHTWCSFLALVLRKELQRRIVDMHKQDPQEDLPEWADIIRDLGALRETELEVGNKRFILRSEARGWVGKVFKACHIALPPVIRQILAQ
jgi:hypothetical protein